LQWLSDTVHDRVRCAPFIKTIGLRRQFLPDGLMIY
jgi:hypothetical protein